MSIALDAVAERSIADTKVKPRNGRTPVTRLTIAQSDRAVILEAR